MKVIFEKTMIQKQCFSSMSSEGAEEGEEMQQSLEEGEEQVEESDETSDQEEEVEGTEDEKEVEGVEGEKGANAEGEATANEEPQYVAPLPIDGEAVEAGAMEEGTLAGGKMPGGKDPLLSHMSFVIGITVLTFFVGALLGGLLARKKIKKGIEIYED